MKKISTFFIIALLFGSFTTFGQVIISQIYEGSSGTNKFIEITNMGSTTVNLASPQLTLKLFSNTTAIGTNINGTKALSGTLAPGQCYILRNGATTIPAYACAYTPSDTSNSTANFNGTGSGGAATSTDIIALYDGTTLVDVFGWGTFQYPNQSFYRNANISSPNATWTVGEWTSVTNAVVDGAAINTIERLGYHLTGGVTNPIITISSPANNSTSYIANVNIAYSVLNFVIPTAGHIHYTLDGGTAVEYSGTSPIALTGLASGAHKVVLTLVDPSHVALVPKAADSVTFNVDLTPPVLTSIYDIQYTTTPPYDSPFKDTTVITSGIVTASFASGYYIQDGTTPWNGLYVYDATHTPAVGDSIIIGGTITEYYNLTELGAITIFSTIASGKPLPLPIDLTTNTVKSEQYEGMLVKLTNAKCTQIIPGGRWKVFQGSDTCYIGKLMYPFTTAVLGSYYNVTGCLNYTFDQFTVEPRSASDVSLYVGVKENELSKINLFPNPVTSEVNIANMEGIQQIKIANLLGEVVGTYNVSGNSTAINVSSLTHGIYFISLWKDNSVSVTRKFIKQ